MLLTAPITFESAVKKLAGKKVTPTNMGTAELRQLPRSVRDQAFYSARNLYEDVLTKFKADVGGMIEPKFVKRVDRITADNPEGITQEAPSMADVRQSIKALLKDNGFQPAAEDAGTIKDLASDARIELVVKTNVEMAQNYGTWRDGQDEDILDLWPAQELVRFEGREKPRAWLERFRLAGQATGDAIGTGWTITPDLRMIALKNHPIWEKLGSSELFEDGLDNPYPPFAFNSGMDVQDVRRDEAVAIGIIDETTKITPQIEPFPTQEAA